MTVTFVVLAHTDPAALDGLLGVLAPYPVVLNVDRSAVRSGYLGRSNAGSMSHVTVNPGPRCVHWGGYSVVRAMMESLGIALGEKSPVTDHIAFLSGQCFPLRPVDEFVAYLDAASNPVHCRAFELTGGDGHALGVSRVSRRHWLDGPIGHLRESAPRLVGGAARRIAVAATAPFSTYPPKMVPACGSQWVAVPRALAQELVTHYLAGGFDYLKNSYAPDELAVPSYIYNSDWAGLTQARMLEERAGNTVASYANFHWFRNDLNGLIDRSDALKALESGQYFIRKVSESAPGGVMDLLWPALRA